MLGARESKGLEFDVVVVLEPQELVDEVEGTVGDLYVAMTRTTQRLRILAEGTDSGRDRRLTEKIAGDC